MSVLRRFVKKVVNDVKNHWVGKTIWSIAYSANWWNKVTNNFINKLKDSNIPKFEEFEKQYYTPRQDWWEMYAWSKPVHSEIVKEYNKKFWDEIKKYESFKPKMKSYYDYAKDAWYFIEDIWWNKIVTNSMWTLVDPKEVNFYANQELYKHFKNETETLPQYKWHKDKKYSEDDNWEFYF